MCKAVQRKRLEIHRQVRTDSMSRFRGEELALRQHLQQ